MRINVFKSGGNSAQGGFVSNGLTLQGPLILSGPHTEPLHAVPKQYVDSVAYNLDAANITSGVLAAARLPAFTGDATTILGTSNIILSATGVTPGSVVKPTVDAKGRITSGGSIVESDISGIGFDKLTVGRPTTLYGYGITDAVKVNGPTTMVGDLVLNGDPTNANHAVTKHYVDAAAGLAGGISIGDIIRKPYATTPSGFLKCNGGEVDKTTYANLYSVIGDTFANDLTPGSGKPWQYQYQFNGVANDPVGWVAGTSMPSILGHSTIVATKNRVYALGGYNGTNSYNTVYTAPVNSDGTIGTWTTGTSLPTILVASMAFVTNNRVYLVGGTTNTVYLSSVYSAPINSDGTIGTWVAEQSLPGLLAYSRIIVTKGRVFTLGGHNGSAYISTIYSATINDDGTIGTWSVYGSLPYAAASVIPAVIKNRLYIFGGNSSTQSYNAVYYAVIDSDGNIGTWNSSLYLPKQVPSGECFVTKNKLYVVITSEVWATVINSDGSLNSWYKVATLSANMTNTDCVITSSRIYLIYATDASNPRSDVLYANFTGGLNDYSSYYGDISNGTTNYSVPGSGKPWQQQYNINTTQSTDITGWTTSTALPATVNDPMPIVTKNRVYLCGGILNGGAVSNNIYTAPINADGTLGTWTTSGTIPGVSYYGQSVVTKNRVYILGGAYTASVYTAPINADGTLGTWTTDVSLPGAVGIGQVFRTKNRVYLCGGNNGGGIISTSYTAPINSDGTLGAWTTGPSLPVGLSHSQAIVTNNRVYLCGGYNGAYTSTVYTATINADGTLGSWSTGTSLPGVLAISQSFVTKNRAYLFGGFNGSAYTTTVYTAPINSDGTLGAWVTGTALPGAIAESTLIATKDHIYLCGGYNGGYLNTVYTASTLGGLNDYSAYYDGTNDLPVTIVNYMTPGSYQPWKQQYQINTTQSANNITSWAAGTALPSASAYAAAFVTKNYAYYVDGSQLTNLLWRAPINADGTLGAWATTTALPAALGSTQAIVTKNRVHLIGGYSSGGTPSSTVYTAPINADGTLGTWATGTSLPGTVCFGAAFATRNRVYYIGGVVGGNTYTSSSYTAVINADGTLGAWSTITAFPVTIGNQSIVVTNNRVYVLGGNSGNTFYNSVYTASINADGTIGNWVATTNLLTAVAASQAFVTHDRVFLFAGYVGNTSVTNASWSAPINSDGTLGTWVSNLSGPGGALPGNLGYSQLIATKNHLYLLGGLVATNTVSGIVYTATIADSLNDYSPYYDGTIQPVSTASTKFKLPDYALIDKEFGDTVTSYIKY